MITGAGGQLATELARSAPPDWSVTALSRVQLDIGDQEAVDRAVSALRPELILNAAAYTAVDRAESEPDAAWRINRDGAGYLAAAAARAGSRMVHISTDFVFDGRQGRPYRPDDEPHPLGVYGASKLAGESTVLAAYPRALVVRTAWVYAAGGRNFLTTMLRLMTQGGNVRVVADQIGAPTSAVCLAGALWGLAQREAVGVWHYTNAGVASWYDFAVAIAEEARIAGLLLEEVRVRPITTSEYPTPAVRPSFSLLDCTAAWEELGEPASHWRAALRDVIRNHSGGA
jgi:dTDP-4-dehydrorhamnose reductase